MLEDRLETMKYGVLRTTNGVEALEVLGMFRVDAVLLDIPMSVMDGRTLLREREHYFFNAFSYENTQGKQTNYWFVSERTRFMV